MPARHAAAAALLLGVAGAAAAGPDDLYLRYFAGAANGRPCYARYYPSAHLQAHPRQQVRRIEIDFDKEFGEGAAVAAATGSRSRAARISPSSAGPAATIARFCCRAPTAGCAAPQSRVDRAAFPPIAGATRQTPGWC
jgi:hypothetical protein